MLTENLRLKDSRAEIEATFNKERKHLLEFLKSNDIDHTNLIDGPNKLIENGKVRNWKLSWNIEKVTLIFLSSSNGRCNNQETSKSSLTDSGCN